LVALGWLHQQQGCSRAQHSAILMPLPEDLSMALNAEDIFALFRETTLKFQETDRLVKELAASSKETDQIVKELAASSKETERMFQETDRRFQETERMFQETDRRFQETDRTIKTLSKNIGSVNNRLGQFVEEMIQPAVLRLFQVRGIAVHEIMRNLVGNRDGIAAEIDLLAVDTTEAVAVEVKSNLAEEHVDQHVQRMDKFKRVFVHYANLQVYGAVAGMVVSPKVARYAESQGLFVLQPSGEHIELGNGPGFSPRSW
jgi:hypothetical protein